MQKKLLTAAIGAALVGATAVAQADVTVYGRAQIEYAQIENNGQFPYGTWSAGNVGQLNNTNTIPLDTTRTVVVDNKIGRFGIKADEDLGSGWKGVVNFEWQVDTADGADGTPISERISTVGISQKSIGTLFFGQFHSPYKLSGVQLDPFVATTLEARNNYGMSGNRDGWGVMNGHNGFVQDGMFFSSASFAGAYVNAYLGLDRTGANGGCADGNLFGNCDAAGGTNNNKTNGDLSAVAGWKGNAGPVGLHVFGGYAQMSNTTTADKPTAMKLAAQVTLAKAHTISLQYEATDRSFSAATDQDEATYTFLGYQGKFGAVTAVAQFGLMETGDYPGGISFEGNYLALGAIYNASKTFRVFGGYRNTVLTFTNAALDPRDDTVITIGMRKDF